jgi:microcystin-dependent protein
MSQPFVAEIKMFGCNFAPRGWAQCNGQILAISQNTALFSLLGTYYGGDGRTTFALPDLQGSAALQSGQGPGLSERFIGELGGTSVVTLIQSEMPAHNHTVNAKITGGAADPNGKVWGTVGTQRPAPNFYASGPGNTSMNPLALSITGGSQPHNNQMPCIVVNFCIALQGIFPPRS